MEAFRKDSEQSRNQSSHATRTEVATARAGFLLRTPEGVEFEHVLAGLGTRCSAWLVDTFLVLTVLAVIFSILSPIFTMAGGFGSALAVLIFFLLWWWYAAIAEWMFRGRTLGKAFFKIRVVDQRGFPLTFPQAVVRNMLRMIDMLPITYLVGAISCIVDPLERRLGDLAAGTVVIRSEARDPRAIGTSSERALFAQDPLLVRAARRVTTNERDAMVALALRRERLPLTTRVELFGQLATHLERRLGIARPPHLSEERFVLGLLDAASAS